MDLGGTVRAVFCDLSAGGLSFKILPNLGRIFSGPASLPFDGFQLHFVSLCFLAGEDVFSLKVAIYHDDGCRIAVDVADDDGHVIETGNRRCLFSSMSRDQFKCPIGEGTRDAGDKYTELLDALNCLLHHVIITNAERMVGVWPQLVQRDALNDF